MKLYFDSVTTLKVIHAESPIVIFFGTYGIILNTIRSTNIICLQYLTVVLIMHSGNGRNH